MKTFSASLALCEGNPPATGGFPSQRPVTRSFDIFFDLCLNKRLSKQSRRRWFETPSRSLWRHCNYFFTSPITTRARRMSVIGVRINCSILFRVKQIFSVISMQLYTDFRISEFLPAMHQPKPLTWYQPLYIRLLSILFSCVSVFLYQSISLISCTEFLFHAHSTKKVIWSTIHILYITYIIMRKVFPCLWRH